jgi:hypothetical protein
MKSFVLQEWVTIRGAGPANPPGATIVQDQDDWLDLSLFQDVFFFIACSEIVGTPTITFETSPTTDEGFFQPIAAATSLVASASVMVIKAPMLTASTSGTMPIARYVRWRLTGSTTPWDATFRVVVAANSPGL